MAIFVVALAVFAVFRPGDQASAGVDLGDPNAWIEHGLDGELLQINAGTGEITARIDVAEPGQSFYAVPHSDGAVVLNTDTNSISVVSGQLLSVTSTVPLSSDESPETEGEDGRIDDTLAEETGVMSVFGSRNSEGDVVVVSDETVLTVDLQTAVITPIALPAPLRSVVQDDLGLVTAMSEGSNEVLQLNSRGLTNRATLPDPVGDTSDQRSMVRAGSGTFVIDPSRLSISEVRANGTFGLPFCTTSAAIGAIAGGSGEADAPVILAFNPTTSTLNVSTPNGGCSDIEVAIDGDLFGAPVASKGFAYIPNWSTGRIIVVDLDEARVVANFPFGTSGVPFDLDVVGSNVWANEPQGPFAAVVQAEMIIPVPKISTIVAGSVTDVDDEGEGSSLTAGSEETSGLRIIGDTGERVIASGANAEQSSDGVGTGPEGGDIFGDDNPAELIEPSAIGIELDAPIPEAEPIPDPTAEEAEPENVSEEVAEIETLIANFSASAGTATEEESLRFSDTTTGSPTSWTWDFGDGTGAQEPNVEKAWATEGVYVISLTVRNSRGDESTQLAEITVVPKTVLLAPTADFSFDRSTIESGESVVFTNRTTGEVDLIEWSFGDGESSVRPTAEHTYDEAGTYTATLTASNSAGSSSTSTTITVLSSVDPPNAAIAQIPTSVVQGQFVTLTSASLNGPTRLAWDFGDGSRGSGESVQHVWTDPGTYRIRLTVENSEGSDSTFVDLVVTKRIDPPVSQFTQSETEVLIGETVTFTNLSLNDPTRLIWDFGDETTANGQTATKEWSRPGRYRVTLRATNDSGTNRTGVTITVVRPVDPPVANFTASATTAGHDQRIDFQDTSTNNPTSWAWDFGDTGTSSNPTTSHEWAKSGTYTVRLTVTNEGGSSTTARQIVIAQAPSANFRWEIVEGTTVKFTDTSWDEPQNYNWDFGDGTTSTDRSPTHTFTGGAFDVTLVVSNDAGTSAPKTQQVATVQPPVSRPVCTADGALLMCSGETSARANGFTWSAPDAISNSTPNQSTTVFAFDSAGRKDVTLTVSNAAGTDEATIRAPRVAAGRAPRVISVDVVSIEGGLVRLEATFDRNPTTWEWSADGAELVEGGNTPEPVFRVTSNGQFDGRVRASNAFGDDTDPFSFEADGFTTTASFTWEVIRPGVVRVRNTTETTGNADVEWRFAGGPDVLNENDNRATLQYTDSGGSFLVVLIVDDDNGRSVAREDVVVPPVEPEEPEELEELE